MTAGRSSAAAVPLVHATIAGRPVAFAAPSARKPPDRSSSCTCTCTRGSRARARASGVERDPGDSAACDTPPSTSPATSEDAHANEMSPSSTPSTS